MPLSPRWRWTIWSIYVTAWTVALLFPRPPRSGVGDVDEVIDAHGYLIHKSVHVAAYALMTILTGALNVPPRYRWLFAFLLAAHGTATEMGQWYTRDVLHWSERIGALHDVAFDNLGVLIGLVLSWKWWTREG